MISLQGEDEEEEKKERKKETRNENDHKKKQMPNVGFAFVFHLDPPPTIQRFVSV